MAVMRYGFVVFGEIDIDGGDFAAFVIGVVVDEV